MGLRDRKKAATRLALHQAALRLAARDGLDHVTVDAIADAANVSRRTFSNYFASKEDALFHSDAEQARRLLRLLREQPPGEAPWTALSRATEQLAAGTIEADPTWLARRRELRTHPSLVTHHIAAYGAVESELAAELANRMTGPDATLRSRLLAATFLAALRVAIQHWIEHPDGALHDVIRTALAHAAPEPTTAAHLGSAAPPVP